MIYKLSVKNFSVPDPHDLAHVKVNAAWHCADVGERDELQGQVVSSSAHCDLPSPKSPITPADKPLWAPSPQSLTGQGYLFRVLFFSDFF